MSWRDRPYSDDDDQGYGYGGGPGELRIRFPRPSMLVAWLVIINVAVHFVNLLAARTWPGGIEDFFGLSLEGLTRLRVWQLVTYMFVHAGLLHLIFNMLLLYFIGGQIERGFGRERFIRFYAVCGIIGGIAYLILGAISYFNTPEITTSPLQPHTFYNTPLVGASGAVWGLLIAAMIFYPNMQIVFIIFPMRIRVFGAIILAILFMQAISQEGIQNLGGEVCHLGGALAGVGVLYYWGMMPAIRFGSGDGPTFMGRLRKGAWARKQRKLAAEQAEVDRILEKVHRDGIASLTRRERKILAEATQRQRERDRQAGRVDRV